MESLHRFIAADARDLSGIADGSVALTVTSPPYPMIAMWDGLFGSLSERSAELLSRGDGPAAFEAMHETLDAVWTELFRVSAAGGIVCINIGDATRRVGTDFRLYSNHSRIVRAMEARGFATLPCIHWRKTTNAPTKFMGSGMLPGAAYVTLEHEYILIFRKGGARQFSADEAQRRRESAIFWEERNLWFSDLWELAGSKQSLETKGAAKPRGRSAAFPFEIPYRLILMHSIKGDLVLDPFVGTGTTMHAAAAAERSSVGVDIEPGLSESIAAGFASDAGVWRSRVCKRLRDHAVFVTQRVAQGKSPAYVNETMDTAVTTGQERELSIRVPESSLREGDSWKLSYGHHYGCEAL